LTGSSGSMGEPQKVSFRAFADIVTSGIRISHAVVVLLISACTSPSDARPPQPDARSSCPTQHTDPPPIDFGCEELYATSSIPFPDGGATPGALTGTGFTLTESGLQFTPVEVREYTGSIPLLRDGCVVGTQRLLGTGSDSVFRWTPAIVDFGYLNLGKTRRERVTFTTCSTLPVELSNLGTREGSQTSMVFGFDAGTTAILAATRATNGTLISGQLTLEVTFTPAVFGPRAGQLVASTTVQTQPMTSVTLRGVGGGPVISVTPTQLDFGAVTAPTTQTVTIRNTGTQPGPPDPRAHLFLGIDGMQPYFELTPGDCGTVTLGPYDPTVGLSAGQSVSITVELTPAAAPRTCTLRLFSTDRDNPVNEVTITAQ